MEHLLHSVDNLQIRHTSIPDSLLVTLGIAQRSREAAPLWQTMADTFGASPAARMSSVPWCAVALHPTLPMFMDAVTWLGDFERCVAWAWITRNPALASVLPDDEAK